MAITLPATLATTMGIELTYMPVMHERIYQATKGKVNTTNFWSEGVVRGLLAKALHTALEANQIPFNHCDTDPACVEVSTNPFSKSRALMRNIRSISHNAKQVELTPVASYTIGGGAHIHTGVLGEDETQREIYKSAFTLWAYNNPWMAWAFAGVNDRHNAEPLAFFSNAEKDNIAELVGSYESNLHMYKHYRESVDGYTRLAHEPNQYYREEYLQSADSYRRDAMHCRKSMQYYAQKILDYYTQDTEATISYTQIHNDSTKKKFIRHSHYGENGTIEFRCFLMQRDINDHAKHIALVNAIVSHVWKQTQDNPEGVFPMPEAINLGMKYSEAKRGFNNMLTGLGLDPVDFRRERVNIALRMRYWRKH